MSLEDSKHVPRHQYQATLSHLSQDLDSAVSSEGAVGPYGSCNNSQFTIFVNEPSPSASLNPGEHAIERRLEIIQRAVFRGQSSFQRAGRFLKGFRRNQIFPEKLK